MRLSLRAAASICNGVYRIKVTGVPFYRLFGAMMLILASVVPGRAAVLASEELVAKLVAEHAVAAPGETTSVMLHQRVAAGWHTYWRNPGDSGQAPTIVWTLPAGVTVAPSEWPVPQRIEYGPLVNFGYSGETALLFEVTVPADWPTGRPVALRAEADLLACAKICVPVYGTLAIDIPSGAKSVRAPEAAALFAQARAQQPSLSPWPASVRVEGNRLTVTLRGAGADFAGVGRADLFPHTWGLIEHASEQRLSITGEGLSLAVPLGEIATPPEFSGIITLHLKDGARRSYGLRASVVAAGRASSSSAPR